MLFNLEYQKKKCADFINGLYKIISFIKFILFYNFCTYVCIYMYTLHTFSE